MSSPFNNHPLPLHERVRLGYTRLQPSWYTRIVAAQQNQTNNTSTNDNRTILSQQASAPAHAGSSTAIVPVHELVATQADQTSFSDSTYHAESNTIDDSGNGPEAVPASTTGRADLTTSDTSNSNHDSLDPAVDSTAQDETWTQIDDNASLNVNSIDDDFVVVEHKNRKR